MLQAGLAPGDRVLIHAVGSGVGLAALQIARVLGCRTLGTSRTASKLERAVGMGLETPLLTGDRSFVEGCLEATSGRGVDVVLDFMGASYLEANCQVLAPGGRLMVVGLMGGATGPLPLELLLTRRLTVRGTTLRARPLEQKIQLARDFEAHMLHFFEDGRLAPVIDRVMPMAAVQGAHRTMERNETFGKVVLTWQEGAA